MGLRGHLSTLAVLSPLGARQKVVNPPLLCFSLLILGSWLPKLYLFTFLLITFFSIAFIHSNFIHVIDNELASSL